MKTVGLIVEYNPLHNGHLYHFQQSKRAADADAVVCVMSGHFLQRGEPALAGKWARAEMALAMGADLVLELPVAYSSQPAEWFAYGAVATLAATGVVDSLCFGSESGELGGLTAAAELLHQEPAAFRAALAEELAAGQSYPAAYSSAVARLLPGMDKAELAKPNNTLGLHYLIALRRLQSAIRPLTIRRTKAEYSQSDVTDARIASATALRKLLLEKGSLDEIRPYVPEATARILEREWHAGRAPVHWELYAQPLLQRLLTQSPEQLAVYAEVTEGLEHRLRHALGSLMPGGAAPVEALLAQLKTRRYTRTKLQRMLLRILLGHTKEELSPARLAAGVSYIRVLGFSERGRGLLKQMKSKAKAPIVTKVTTAPSPFLELDIRATSVYALAYREFSSREWLRDYYEAPVRSLSSEIRTPDDQEDFGSSVSR
ncbi:Predicted nucleotidyltransferase [Paenibacillus sp. UNCCL117]|uniref:nucleotidyltransferase n=1 Tax=unclassified Paenibacillus TaxID=185978 RepID=UPI00088759D9|nr:MULTISPECIES: nucleotidyltransferase [unclassified Paenibacillus]SDD95910.1 Predicted nucleotidyltransferase [Paenibacillus sp. cl123]SFW56507.1 Predicted nucleotidyltransferase [Paenibacillus sp. UNCCL117]